MSDEEMKKLFKRFAEMYEIEPKTAKLLFQKILKALYREE